MSACACACAGPPRAPAQARTSPSAASSASPADARPAPLLSPSTELWFFEWLSSDGKRALLRRIGSNARATFQARVVDVDTGTTVAEATLDELGKLPPTTIGRPASEIASLDAMLGAPAFGEDLVRGAQIAGAFPFGSCGRFSAAKGAGAGAGAGDGAIAFNAGDWLYLADKSGRIKRRVAQEAAYDPRFTPDGKHLLFRRASGKIDRVRARYELFVVPADLSAPPRPLAGTAGARDRLVVDRDGRSAVTIASQEPFIKTCALSVALRPPFSVKRLACLDGGEQLVESVLSPTARWAALTTQKQRKPADGPLGLEWRLRVVSLESGKIMLDEPTEPGLVLRAINDAGLLVQSGERGALLIDVPGKTRRLRALELDHRGFFRSPNELVFARGASVGVIDVSEN